MKYIILAFILLLNLIVDAQNVTINYQTWNPSSPPCNIFASATNVPATGVLSGFIEHQTKVGQPTYNSIDQAIQMPTLFESSGGAYKGTKFRIAYDFKIGYSYLISVNIAADANTVGFPTGPHLSVDINSTVGGSAACNGVGNVSPNFGGNPGSIKVPSNIFSDIQFSPFVQGSNQSTLELTAIPAADAGSKTILLRKITIVETPPTPSFTLTQSAGDVSCGTATSKVFTVNNVYNSPGALSYDWNLGANNGWKYNGVDAPATFTTSTNSITLVSSTTAASVSNVSVVPKINATGYPNLTAAVTFTSGFANNISINAPASRCPSGSFSINNLPSNATVTWQANPSNIVSFPNPSTGNPITITKQGDGSTAIIATVSVNQCQQSYSNTFFYGQTPTTGSYKVGSGSPISANNPVNYVPPSQLITLTLNNTASIPGSPFSIQKVYGNSFLNVFSNTATFSLGNYSNINAANGTITILSSIATSCATSTIAFNFTTKGQCALCGSLFRVSPNPASDAIKVEELDANSRMAKASSTITAIELIDNTGNIVFANKFTNKSQSSLISIPVANLKKDIYTIRIFNGDVWDVQKIIIQR